MLQSIRSRECDDARRLLGAALSLLLVFRLLLGPALLPPPAPGLVPICGGTEILYLSLDGSVEAPGGTIADPCPFHGLTAEAAEPVLPLTLPLPQRFAEQAPPAIPAPPHLVARTGYSSRAPPFQV